MTVYTVVTPTSHCLGWYGDKKTAWKVARKRVKINDRLLKKPSKKELKAKGYKLDKHTSNDPNSGDEQMMLMGR